MTTKREEAEQAMRLGPIVAKESERVDLLREAIHEALEEAAKVADREAKSWDYAYTKWLDAKDKDAADRCASREVVATDIADAIRALKTGA